MSDDGRLDYQTLADKFVVAGFLRAPLSEDVIERFEDEAAKGRQFHEGYMIHVDRTVRKDEDFHKLCAQHFMDKANPYNPYFWVVLDERTAKDGTIIVYHDRKPDYDRKAGEPPEEMRATPSGLQVLLSCLDIGELTIPDILINDRPDGEEDTWVYDVPFDYSEIHRDIRVPLDQFDVSTSASGDFTVLRVADVSSVAPNFESSSKIVVWWFGQPPKKVLLQRILDEKQNKSLVTYSE